MDLHSNSLDKALDARLGPKPTPLKEVEDVKSAQRKIIREDGPEELAALVSELDGNQPLGGHRNSGYMYPLIYV
eukprot:8413333-Pyramimonas_sp.AAC.2